MLDEQEDLVFELQELQTEVEENSRTLDNLCGILERNNEKLRKLKQMNDAQRNTNEAVENKLQNNNWSVAIRNAHYQLLEVVDENTVKIEGVEYKKVEKPKAPTLYDALCEKGNMYANVSATVCEIVKEWMPAEVIEDGEDYSEGWNNCIKYLRERIK
jgi:predicted nuclease with TOPRIM domain